jgi:surface-anchored protein
LTTRSKSLRRPLVLLAAVGGLAAAAVVAPAPALAAEQVVLSTGHVDAIDVHYENSAFVLKVRDDTVSPAVTRDPADVTFHAKPESEITVPDVPSYAFLGAPGSKVWILPQIQDPNLLWPGWETLNLPTGTFTGGKIRLSLVGVEGPGAVSVFVNDAFGAAQVLFRSDDGLPDAIDVGDHVHAHANWAFGALGEYTLKFQVEATLFTATEALNGCQYKAVLYDDDHNAVAESPAVTLVVGDGGGPGDPGASQSIVATVRASDGALVLSVDPNDRTVQLPATAISGSGDRLEAAGALRPVTVTDTRATAPGWNASGQVSAFTADGGGSFGGKYLGWTPQVLGQADGQGVVPGPADPPGFTSGDGLADGGVLGQAPAGSGRGTARLGADLKLELPTDTAAGTYTATLTLTAI